MPPPAAAARVRDEEPVMIEETLLEAEVKMDRAIEVAREELSGIRSGRVGPGLLQKITVDYYGTATPLQQLASIAAPEARLLVVNPYDRNVMAGIEKALRNSDLGVNPSNDGQVIRLAFPPLTEERRRQLVKMVRARAEEARVGIRNVRRHESVPVTSPRTSCAVPSSSSSRSPTSTSPTWTRCSSTRSRSCSRSR
jgi:ribosome recycling factor